MPVFIQTLLNNLFLSHRESSSLVSTVQITDPSKNRIGS